MPKPKLSIITVNLNNAAGLERTILSVVDQNWTDFEFIIIDGGSTDLSLDIIKAHESKISYWVSEPDRGVYNAMNKGIAIATGEYLYMLNSGDFLTKDTILECIFKGNPTADLIYTDVLREKNKQVFKVHHPAKLSFQFFRDDFIVHQSIFIRKSLHDLIGLYDEELKIVADWKFLLLAVCKFNASYLKIPVYSSQCDQHGMSYQGENWPIILAERKKIFEEEFPAFMTDYMRMDDLRNAHDNDSRKLYIRIGRRIERIFHSLQN